jgi:hypothetical protein
MKLKWKISHVDWYRKGNCWRWTRITRNVYYSGNQIWFSWGRIGLVLERKVWIHGENV